jgi:potassium efflux system protein
MAQAAGRLWIAPANATFTATAPKIAPTFMPLLALTVRAVSGDVIVLRRSLLSLIFGLCALIAPTLSFGDETAASIDQITQQLDRARATLDAAHKTLEDPNLGDSELRQLRDGVDPLRSELESLIDRLSPRFAAVEARLKELAPAGRPAEPPKPTESAPPQPPQRPPLDAKPEPPKDSGADVKNPAQKPATKPAKIKRSAEPAPPVAEPATAPSAAEAAASAELVEQRKLFDSLDATLKRARALMLEARQLSTAIVGRQRDLFSRLLFLNTDSLFSPNLWRAAMSDAPGVFREAEIFLRARSANFLSRINDSRAEFVFLICAIIAFLPPALLLSRRLLGRNPDEDAPTKLRRAAVAGWTALVAASAPVAAALLLGMVLHAYDALDGGLEPLWQRLLESVGRISFVYGIARAVFAPTHPEWRLLNPGDERARIYVRLLTIIAVVLSITRIVEQIEESVQAGLPLVIVTRGVGVLIVAMLFLVPIFFQPALSPEARLSSHGRDWVMLSRIVDVLAVMLIVGACALGYVTFAYFIILQVGWLLALVTFLYLFVVLAGGGVEMAFSTQNFFGRALVNAFGLRNDQLAPIGVFLAGVVTIVGCAAAAVVAVAPWGYQSQDFIARIRSSFFAVKFGDVTISLSALLQSALIFFLVLAAAQALRRWLDTRLLPLTRLDLGFRNSIGATLGYAGFIVAAMMALSNLGIGVEKLAIVAGALSVGIGFGLQSIVNNFVSGLILLWERAIRVGDWVVLGEEQGYIRRINVRSTEIETFDRATMIVPNSNLVAGVVKNWLRGDRVGRIKIALSPHAGVDPEQMRDIMLAAARAQEDVLRVPAPQVMFLGMDSSSFKFELWCYVEDVEKSSRVRSDLHFDLHRRLKIAGVTIAAPTTPTTAILQIPEPDKLAAAAAATALALESDIANITTGQRTEEAGRAVADADDGAITATPDGNKAV